MLRAVAIVLLSLFGASCGGGGGGGDGDDSAAEQNTPAGASSFSTSCGVVGGENGLLMNPVPAEDGTFYSSIDVLSPNVVALNSPQGSFLVKLLALDSAIDARADQSMQALRNLVAGGAYFYKATPDCSITTESGGTGTSGQLITPDGRDVGEEIVKAGFGGQITVGGTCHEELISGCYAGLAEQFAPKYAGSITEFLWKPESEGEFAPGKLAVLINAEPCNVYIVVNGEILQNYGPTNGRCMTSRSGTRSGCEFGANAKVEVFNEESKLPYVFPDGNPYIINPNGCERLQFKLQ